MKDNSIRSQIALAIFAAITVSSLVNIWSDYLQVQILERISAYDIPTDSEITANDMRVGILAMAHLVLIIGSIFAFLYWFRRAYANLKTQIDIAYADNMAVWAFFIPFVNLFRPAQVALDLNSSTKRKLKKLESSYPSSGTGAAIAIWWATYLISNFVSNISARMSWSEDESISHLIESSRVSMFSGALDVVSALTTIWFIYVMTKQEEALLEAVAEKEFAEMEGLAEEPAGGDGFEGIAGGSAPDATN